MGKDGETVKALKIALVAVGIVLLIDLLAWLWAGNGQIWRVVFCGVSPTIRGWF